MVDIAVVGAGTMGSGIAQSAALGEGVASKEDIDRAMKLGTNYPRDPFEWAEEIGVRTILRTLDSRREAYGEAYIAAPSFRAEGRSGA